MTHHDSRVVYTEKVNPSAGMWALITGAALSTALMVFPVWKLGAVILPIIAFAFLTWWLRSLAITIVITDAQLIVGDAHIDRSYLGEVHPYASEAAREARGTGLDARAFLMIRPWVKTSVRIDINDDTDPTPYWLVSSRSPREMAEALNTRPS